MPRRLLALALLAVTACGGDSGSSQSSPSNSPSASALTKEAYVAAANGICKSYNAKFEQVPEPESAEQFSTSITALLDLMDQAQAELRALNPPPEHRADIEAKFLVSNEQQSAALRAALPKIDEAAKKQDSQAATLAFAEAFGEMEKLSEPQDKWAKDFGLTECTS